MEKKKSVVVVGITEEFMPNRQAREKKGRKAVEKIIEAIQEEDHELIGEIEEVFKLGEYREGAQRPVKVRFRSLVATEEVIEKTWKLARTETYKQV